MCNDITIESCDLVHWIMSGDLVIMCNFITPQPLRAVEVLFSPMAPGWAVRGKSLSGQYLRNCKVQEVDTW